MLQAATIAQSMSRKANCWDNAPMKSFFGTLKAELVHQREYPDRDVARRDLFAYIEGYYNRQRSHSAIGYIPPEFTLDDARPSLVGRRILRAIALIDEAC
jgi:putative transposase